jgi:tetratricopeptide (TPR) repeat protein
MRRPSFRGWLAGAALAALAALLAGCPGGGGTGPLKVPGDVSRDRYEQMVAAFYPGVAAVEAGFDSQALPRLKQATSLVPEEPAAWADLALAQMRTGDLPGAAASLKRARELAKPNSTIELLSGVLATRQGQVREALGFYRKAVELDPRNLLARFALQEELGREPGPGATAETQRQLEAILAVQPQNLVVLIELARLAAKTGNADLLRQTLARIRPLSEGWPADYRQRLAEVERLAAGADPRGAATAVIMLGNVLKQTPQFQQGSRAVRGTDSTPVQPVRQFLRLPLPVSQPGAPDAALRFIPELVGKARARWAGALPLRIGLAAEQGAIPPPDGPPVMAVAREKDLVLDANPTVALPRPDGQPGSPGAHAPVMVDWNDDSRPDLALVGPGGIRLYQQAPGFRWRDVTGATRLPPAVVKAGYTGAWPFDLDLDGDLDLALGSRAGPPLVLRNNGDGTWAVVRPFNAVAGLRAFGWGDLDGDGDPDVALADAAGQALLFENDRAGAYHRGSLPTDLGAVTALCLADADRDGQLDLVTLAEDGGVRRVGHAPPGQTPPSAEIARWTAARADSAPRMLWADLDNNGAADLVIAGTAGGQLWLADANATLVPLASPLSGWVTTIADLNGDGRLDLAGLDTDGTPLRLLNGGTTSYHWQVLRPRAHPSGTNDRRVNSFGIGGMMELRAGMLATAAPIGGPQVHIGLGDHPKPDVARIVWPNGQVQGEFEFQPGQPFVATQRLNISCPWLFAWNGSDVRFVTDILWKSPLGLNINAQAPEGMWQTRDWVRVRGDQLALRDGFYDLRITAELWETHYFDHVGLMAVDHPAGTEVFIDERFSVPQPPLKVHVTTPPIPVGRAADDRGQDVTASVRDLDGRYLDTFGIGAYQGVTRDHFVEVELPAAAPREGPVWLVASGWIYPTNSSINVALSQGSHPRPEGLSLEVPDGRGGWRTARRGLGFPAGKTKTILLDLSGLFPAGSPEPRRLRLRTNLEIYWDRLAVAGVPPAATPALQQALPQTANLRFRGFSTVESAGRMSPDLPNYNRLAGTLPRWFDLIGFYTRFGDVRELVEKVDDRYVIMNAGDELAMRFPAFAPARAGWERDYVFISDGWEKDGDFNTTFSKTVLPLPSHADKLYNRPPGRLEDDPVYRRHQRDWLTYHTRYVTPEVFTRLLRPDG